MVSLTSIHHNEVGLKVKFSNYQKDINTVFFLFSTLMSPVFLITYACPSIAQSSSFLLFLLASLTAMSPLLHSTFAVVWLHWGFPFLQVTKLVNLHP